jgi:hypothetical protein
MCNISPFPFLNILSRVLFAVDDACVLSINCLFFFSGSIFENELLFEGDDVDEDVAPAAADADADEELFVGERRERDRLLLEEKKYLKKQD